MINILIVQLRLSRGGRGDQASIDESLSNVYHLAFF